MICNNINTFIFLLMFPLGLCVCFSVRTTSPHVSNPFPAFFSIPSSSFILLCCLFRSSSFFKMSSYVIWFPNPQKSSAGRIMYSIIDEEEFRTFEIHAVEPTITHDALFCYILEVQREHCPLPIVIMHPGHFIFSALCPRPVAVRSSSTDLVQPNF